MNDWCGRAWSTLDGTTPEEVCMDCLGKETEQAKRLKIFYTDSELLSVKIFKVHGMFKFIYVTLL